MADITLKFGVQGEQAMRTAIAGVNSQISSLNAEMKLAVAEMAGMTSEEEKNARKKKVLSDQIEAYNKKASLLSKKYEEQKEKLEKLKENLDKTAESTGENSDATARAQTAYNKQVKVVNSLGSELKKTEANMQTAKNEMDSLGKETEETSEKLEKGEGNVKDFGTALKAYISGEAIIQGVKKLASSLKDLALGAASLSDELATQASVTGLSTDALQEYRYMAELVDVSVDTITGSMTKLTKTMNTASKGSGDAYDAFKKLHVSFQNVDGSLRDNEEVFNDLIDALGHVENETERDALAMTLFGKSAQELNPLIKAGSKQIKAYAKEAHDMGYVMSKDVIKKNTEASDSLERMKNSVSGAKNAIGATFAPAIKSAADALSNMVKWGRENTETLKNIGAIITTAAIAVVSYKAAVTAVEIATKASTIATKAAAAAQAILNGTLAANPFGIVLASITALIAALVIFKDRSIEVDASVTEMQSSINDFNETLGEHAKAWEDVTYACDALLEEGNSELNYYQELFGELQQITDANGKVKEGYEDRAAFITGALSESLGVEIKMTDGVIQGYDNLAKSVEKVITQKRAELALKAQEEAYTQAIKKREQANLDLIKAEENRTAALTACSKTNAELADLEAEKASMLKSGYSDYTAVYMKDLDKRIEAKKEEARIQSETLETASADFITARDVVNEVSYTIAQYEANLAYAHKQEYDKISTVNAETARSYSTLSKEAQTAMDDLTGGMAKQASDLYKETSKVGENYLLGFENGSNNNIIKSRIRKQIQLFGEDLLNTTRNSLKEKSPSKATRQMGEYLLQGLGLGIKDEEKDVLAQISSFGETTLEAFSTATRGGFNVGKDAGSGLQLSAVNGDPVITAGKNTYIIKLQLDGRDIAQNTSAYQSQWRQAFGL